MKSLFQMHGSSVSTIAMRSAHRLALVLLVTAPLPVARLAAQQAEAGGKAIEPVRSMDPKVHPVLEVATIKISDPNERNQGLGFEGNHLRAERQTLLSLMMFAYGVHGKQVVGAPDWMTTQQYDVRGVIDQPGEPNVKQLQELFAGLLAERFALRFHHEQRELPHWNLVVAPGGPHMERSKDQDAVPDQTGNGSDKGMTMVFTSNAMPDLVLGLQYFLTRPLADATHLSGRYTFTLRWTPDSMRDLHEDAAPALATALQEQLGLKLESAKGSLDVLVIDRVEQPSPN